MYDIAVVFQGFEHSTNVSVIRHSNTHYLLTELVQPYLSATVSFKSFRKIVQPLAFVAAGTTLRILAAIRLVCDHGTINIDDVPLA